MYVETRGPTLEEVAKVIDGDRAEVAQLDLHQVEKETQLATHSMMIFPARSRFRVGESGSPEGGSLGGEVGWRNIIGLDDLELLMGNDSAVL